MIYFGSTDWKSHIGFTRSINHNYDDSPCLLAKEIKISKVSKRKRMPRAWVTNGIVFTFGIF